MKQALKVAPSPDVLREAASIALEKNYQKAPVLSVAYVVRVCFDIIEKHKAVGMRDRQIAEALSESIMPVNLAAFKTAYRVELIKRANRQGATE